MKIAAAVARYLLGGIFVVFALNFWINFLPAPEMEEGSAAAQFFGAIAANGFLTVVKLLELIGGLLLLSGRYVNLGLAVLGPIVVNIGMYHLFISKSDYPMAAVLGVLAVVALAGQRDFVKALLAPK